MSELPPVPQMWKKECICPWEHRDLGYIDNYFMGSGWIRMSTHPTCPEHGDKTEITEAARLSRILWDAREQLDMWSDVCQKVSGQVAEFVDSLRDDIDEYRAEKGWSPNGFGGEK